MKTGIGGHHARRRGHTTDDWITPRYVIDALGGADSFTLDPCACDPQPWPTARTMWTFRKNGLLQLWRGRVWCNPPYGRLAGPFLERLASHGNGIALLFARTETAMWFKYVWPMADAILFLKGRLTFYRASGEAMPPGHNSGGPSVLIAYGEQNIDSLRTCGLDGKLIWLK